MVSVPLRVKKNSTEHNNGYIMLIFVRKRIVTAHFTAITLIAHPKMNILS